MKDFFISYNKADRQWAEWIAWQLEEEGYTTVLQAWDFRPADNFVLEMHKAIIESDRTIIVLSQSYIDAVFTQPEWAAVFAQDPESKKGTLLPVRVRECKPPGLLAPLVYIDLVGLEDAEAKNALLKGVKRERAKPETEPAFPKEIARSVLEKPSFPGDLPPIWNVPSNRNPNFTGRVELLEQLRETLLSGKAAALTQAITGLGGVGKTQLALEYSYRHSNEYRIVWWVSAEEPAKLAADYAALAQPLNLPEKDVRDQETIGRAVWDWLGHNSGWLLVFDNAPDAETVRKYIPQGQGGHVIVTSRDPNWSGVAGELSVQVMTPDEARAFLLRRTKQSDGESAADIAKELGYLPLALEQAGAYMEATGKSLSDYLDLYRTHQTELLQKSKPKTDYEFTVATTWEMAFGEISKGSPEAIELTNLCAFLAPDDIPLDVIIEGAKHLPKALAAAVADSMELDTIKAALRRYSLVEISGDNLTVHRLVQAVIRDRLTEDEKKQWTQATVGIIDDVFPQDSNDVRTWPECSRLLPHATASADHAEGFNIALQETGNLQNNIGCYLLGRAEFRLANTTFERGLKIWETSYGKDSPKVASVVNNLGSVLRVMGELEGAREHFERALKIWETSLGLEHPQVATCVNNLGLVLHDMGDLEGARKHYERALKIGEATLGPDHPNVAIRVNNLGGVLKDMGDLDGARKHFERALKIDEASYGTNHPAVARDVNNLGSVLQAMGDLDGARKHFERALKIDEASYGPDHPNVAIRVNNLGGVLQAMGDLEGARENYERALKIWETSFGPNHPNVAIAINNLGGVLKDMGDLEGAREHYERAIKIDKGVYGENHPDVAMDIGNLGRVLRDMGKVEEARAHYERALKIFRNYLGEDHPNVITVKENLASLDGLEEG